MTRRAAAQRGFSLLELMVALAILALSLGTLYAIEGGVLRSARTHDAHERATLFAQSILDARDTVAATGWNEAGESAGFSWEVSSQPEPLPEGLPEAAPRLHRVQVRVAWAPERTLLVSTLLPQALPAPAEALP